MDGEDARKAGGQQRSLKLFIWAIACFGISFWVPFGYFGLHTVSIDTPFSALLVLIGLPAGIYFLRAAMSPSPQGSSWTEIGDTDHDFGGDCDGGGDCD